MILTQPQCATAFHRKVRKERKENDNNELKTNSKRTPVAWVSFSSWGFAVNYPSCAAYLSQYNYKYLGASAIPIQPPGTKEQSHQLTIEHGCRGWRGYARIFFMDVCRSMPSVTDHPSCAKYLLKYNYINPAHDMNPMQPQQRTKPHNQ